MRSKTSGIHEIFELFISALLLPILKEIGEITDSFTVSFISLWAIFSVLNTGIVCLCFTHLYMYASKGVSRFMHLYHEREMHAFTVGRFM